MDNSTKVALHEIREAFEGEADRLELKTEDDVVDLVKQFRKENLRNSHKNNA